MKHSTHSHLRVFFVVLVFMVTVTTVSSSVNVVFAATYNYFADGTDFDLTGMFECSTPLSLCTPPDIFNYMFEVVGGPLDGYTFLQTQDTVLDFLGVGLLLQVRNPTTGELIFVDALSTGIRTISVNPPPAFASTALLGGDISLKQTSAVPAPGTVLLFATGLAGLAGYRFLHRP